MKHGVLRHPGLWTSLLVLACTPADRPPTAVQLHAFGSSSWSLPTDAGSDVNASNSEISPALSSDDLRLYFSSARDGGHGGFDIWVSRRASPCDPFAAPVNLGPSINSTEREQGAFVSRDGHLLFFMRGNAGLTSGDLYVSHRTDVHDDLAWGPPVPLGPDVNTAQLETEPWLVLADGAAHGSLYFGRGVNNNSQDFYAAPITRDGTTLGPAVAVPELNSSGTPPLGNEDGLSVRADGREAIFASRRLSTGAAELFVATRANPNELWGAPQLLSDLNSARPELHPALSHDGRTLAWSSVRSAPGEFRIYLATRTPSGREPPHGCATGP